MAGMGIETAITYFLEKDLIEAFEPIRDLFQRRQANHLNSRASTVQLMIERTEAILFSLVPTPLPPSKSMASVLVLSTTASTLWAIDWLF